MDPNTPLWALSAAAAMGALVGAGYGVAKLVRHVGDQWLEWRKKKREADKDEQTIEKRSSATEAWEVVDRLTTELEKVAPRIEALEVKASEAEKRALRCEGDHDGTKRVLQVVVAWGEQKGLKLPASVRAEVFRQTAGLVQPGSDVHRTLNGEVET